MRFSRNVAFLFISLALLAYTIYRAANISFVYDESYTYFSFVNNSLKSVINYDFVTANNHVLNSVLMQFTAGIFPVNQLTMRLPNLLAHAIFLFFSYRITRHYKPFLLQLSLFVFLNINPFLLDFFSLARGYGLAIAFTLGSLYYFQQFFRGKSAKFPVAVAMFLMAASGVLASFSLLNFYLPFLGIFILVLVFYHNISLQTKLLCCSAAFIITACLFAYVLPVCIKLRQANELFFGGETGFWQDTVNSLIQGYLYSRPYAETGQIILQVAVILALLGGLFFSVYILWPKNAFSKNKSVENLILPALFLLLLLGAASTIIQFHLLGTKYLIERTALMFLPVFGVFLTELFYRAYQLIKPIQFAIYSFTGLAFLHFAFCINPDQVYIWKDSSKPMLTDLQEYINSQNIKKPVNLQAIWAYEGTLNFYRTTNELTWLEPVKRIDTVTYGQADFLFTDESTLNNLDTTNFRRIKTYSQSHSVLLKSTQKQ